MDKLGQVGIILLILSIGELIQVYFKTPIPTTVLGMIILLSLLILKILKLNWVDGISQILLDNMGIMFVPAGVGIMNEFHQLKASIIEIIVIVVITSILVMVTTGYTVQLLMNKGKNRRIS